MRRKPRKDSLKRFNKNYGDNKTMNSDVYKLRRRVMGIIYDIRKVVADLPRVQVRIAENGQGDKANVLGVATMGHAEIWIKDKTFSYSDAGLHHVVLHELCHAIFATPHYDKCHLMAPSVPTSFSKAKARKAFIKYAKGAGYKMAKKQDLIAS